MDQFLKERRVSFFQVNNVMDMGESLTLSEFPSFCFAYVNILISRGDWLPDAGDI